MGRGRSFKTTWRPPDNSWSLYGRRVTQKRLTTHSISLHCLVVDFCFLLLHLCCFNTHTHTRIHTHTHTHTQQANLKATVSSLKSKLTSYEQQLDSTRHTLETEKSQSNGLREELQSQRQSTESQRKHIQSLQSQLTSSSQCMEENRQLSEQLKQVTNNCSQAQELAAAREKVKGCYCSIRFDHEGLNCLTHTL